MSSLHGKVALITGGAQGIGLATAKLLLQNKAKVAIVDIDSSMGKTSCAKLQAEFSEDMVKFYETDITREEDLKAVFVKTVKEFGQLDIVCNIAGVAHAEDWRRLLDINLVAVVSGTFLGIEHMSTQKGGNGGSIINMSSLTGLFPAPDVPVYAASKHGIVGFTRSMAFYATTDSVRVNCICPGIVRTRLLDHVRISTTNMDKIIEMLGMAEPEAVAEVVLELITDTSKVGAVVTLTGYEKKYLNLMKPEDFKLMPNTDPQ